jgi:hypothetical protein
MSTTSQYASVPKVTSGSVGTADISTTAPTVATTLFTAGSLGSRIEKLTLIGLGTSVAALLRLFIVTGNVGVAISAIAFTTTTATVTTSAAHGLSTGALVTIQGASPFNYNIVNAAITVSSTTVFTYTMATTPTTNATSVGTFMYTQATALYSLLAEIPLSVVVGSTTAVAFKQVLSSMLNSDVFPIILQPGQQLRATVTVAQTNPINAITTGGDF